MVSSYDNARTHLAAWLRERSAAIKECERKADVALHNDNNESAYRDLMKQKAALLSTIAGDAAAFVGVLSGQEKERVRENLSSFSQNAQTALHLDSVFYMSALLYPDDHRKGEPDNLEKLIISLL